MALLLLLLAVLLGPVPPVKIFRHGGQNILLDGCQNLLTATESEEVGEDAGHATRNLRHGDFVCEA